MTSAKVIGVYPVPEADTPCHLVEIVISGGTGVFDIGGISQEVRGQPTENWQVPYAERIVSADGQEILTEEFEADEHPDLWNGDFRLAFFFHYLDPNRELTTPFGLLRLPNPTDMPFRLRGIIYEAP